MSKLITNTIRHVDGSNDNITLDSSQNVTVENNLTVDGTSTLTGNVTCSGQAQVSSDLDIASDIRHIGDTDTKIRFPAADTVTAETGGSERLSIDSSGKIGIGTTSPTELFTVKGLSKFEATNSTNGWVNYTHTDNTYRLNYNGAGNDEIVIYSDGYVTTPKLPCFWYCSLSNTESNSAVSSSEILVFSTERHNNGSHYNTSNGRFTAPVSGNYQFGFNGILDNNQASNHRLAEIHRNGSNVGVIAYNYHTNGQYTLLSGTAVLYMAKDDYVSIYALEGMHVGSETSFWGTLIG